MKKTSVYEAIFGRGMKNDDQLGMWMCIFTCFLSQIAIHTRRRQDESQEMEARTGSS